MVRFLKPIFRKKFARIKQLRVYYGRDDQKAIGPTIGWLTANNGEPKFLIAWAMYEFSEVILVAIKNVKNLKKKFF